MYLTTDRFRSMGLGIDLTDVEDVEIRSAIHRASAMVDSYCSVPSLPVKHDFRGGTITGEQHRWRLPVGPFEMGSRRFYPFHTPVQSIQQFRIYVTNTQYVQIDPAEIYIQNSEGYAEVVSLALTSAGLFNALIIPNVGLATPTGVMNYTYGYRFGVSGEELDDTDAYTYQGSNGWWADDPAPVIYVDGVEQTTGYTVHFDEGTVEFDDPLGADVVVTADYTYRLPDAIAEATALITAWNLGETAIRQAGLEGLDSLQVQSSGGSSIELRRRGASVRVGGSTEAVELPTGAAELLDAFVFRTARG